MLQHSDLNNPMKLPGITTQKAHANQLFHNKHHPISFEENSITVQRQKSLNNANSFNYGHQVDPVVPSKGITPKQRRHQLMKQATTVVKANPLDHESHKSSLSQLSPSAVNSLYS